MNDLVNDSGVELMEIATLCFSVSTDEQMRNEWMHYRCSRRMIATSTIVRHNSSRSSYVYLICMHTWMYVSFSRFQAVIVVVENATWARLLLWLVRQFLQPICDVYLLFTLCPRSICPFCNIWSQQYPHNLASIWPRTRMGPASLLA